MDDALLAGVLAAALLVSLKFVDYAYDDAYITYRYARNIVEGHGFVYNLEHNFLGTTTPLYTLLLAAFGVFVPIPLASGLVSVASLLGGIFFVERIGRDAGIRCAGSLAGLFWIFEPQVYLIFGGETLLVYFLLLPLGLWLDRRGRSTAAAVVFGLAVLARMDAVLFVALRYGERLIRERRLPLREGLVFGATLLPWAVYAWATFGSPFPSTLGAKMAQGQSGAWRLFLDGAADQLPRLSVYAGPLGVVGAGLFGLGLLRIARVERVFGIFVVASVLFAVAYQVVLHVAFSHWYLANVYVTNAIVLGAGIREVEALATALGRRGRRRGGRPRASAIGSPASLAATAVLAAVISLQLAPGLRSVMAFDTMGSRRAIYTALGRWLEANTPPDATVSYYEIGYVGWFSRRTIIDPVGLVTPGGIESIRRGRLDWVFDAYDPDYYVHGSHLGRRGVVARPWFERRYTLVHTVREPRHPTELLVYARRREAPERGAR